MKGNLEICTSWILRHEGGYVNHPDDPGGATNFGVIQATYDGYRRRKGMPTQSVRHIKHQEVLEIYKEQYWDKVWGDRLPHGLDYALYDFAINSGPGRAIKFIQKLVGVKQDGVLGNQTFDAILDKNDIEGLIQQLCLDRWNWLKRLRHYKTFGRGWTRRVMGNVIEGVQADSADHDEGVIDRATYLFRHQSANGITAPKELADGANARTDAEEEDLNTSEKVKESISLDNFGKVAGGAVPGAIAGASALPEGPLQYAAAAVAVILAIVAALVIYKKFVK